MIRKIEKLGAKLQVRALRQTKLLLQREIPIDDSWAGDRIAAGVAIAELRVARQPVYKRAEVEEVAGILLAPGQVRVDADVVGVAAAVIVLNRAGTAEGRQR